MKMGQLTTPVFLLCPNPVRKTPCPPHPARRHLHRRRRHKPRLTPGVVTVPGGIREKVTTSQSVEIKVKSFHEITFTEVL